MGGMGRTFDRSYAEYTCVPAAQVQIIKNASPLGDLGKTQRFKKTSPSYCDCPGYGTVISNIPAYRNGRFAATV
jgi:hypothetical protein